jgi:hypothetical protein
MVFACRLAETSSCLCSSMIEGGKVTARSCNSHCGHHTAL